MKLRQFRLSNFLNQAQKISGIHNQAVQFQSLHLEKVVASGYTGVTRLAICEYCLESLLLL